MTMLPTETLPDVLGPQPDLRSRGMFGGNGKNALLAALAGFMARRNPQMATGIMGGLQEELLFKQRQALAEQQYQSERQDKRSDFVFENQWKLDHPAATNNDTVADYDFITKTLGPEAGKQFLQSKTNPVVMTPYGPMPYSSVMGSSQQPQVIQALPPRAKPLGAGGPTPQASGGFPGY